MLFKVPGIVMNVLCQTHRQALNTYVGYPDGIGNIITPEMGPPESFQRFFIRFATDHLVSLRGSVDTLVGQKERVINV